MSGKRKVIHTDDELKIGSRYLRYHIRMYVETLLWLRNHPTPVCWDTVGNALLENHLIHARVLINFVSKSNPNNRNDDVLAEDYFHDVHDIFEPMQDTFLKSQAQDIGGQAVHITKKSMPKLRSQKDWPIRDIVVKLIPAVERFLNTVPETRLADTVKDECLNYLAMLTYNDIPASLHPST